MPKALANCYTLVKMCNGHADASRELIQNTIHQESLEAAPRGR